MSFKEALSPLVANLFYPSESDEPIEWFSIDTECLIDAQVTFPLTAEQFKRLMQLPEDEPIEPLDVPAFWEKVTTVQSWYGDVEKATVQQFEALRDFINEQLTDVQGFRVGETEVEIYLFGRDQTGGIQGIKTLVIET